MKVEEVKREVLEHFGLGEVNSGTFYGEWADIEGRDVVSSYSPIDGSEIAKVAMSTREDYERVMKKAMEAFRAWSDIPAPKRGEVIREIGNELRKEKKMLGRLVSLEVGKILTEGEGEVQEMIDIGDFAVGLSRQLYGLTIASERKEHRLYEQWHPLGPIGVITAFNFPCAVWSWNAFIAAVVGDVVVWKPSTKAPLTAIATIKVVNRVIERKGLPPIFLLAIGRGSTVGNWMSEDRNLPLISFTGSVATGKKIYEKVSRRLGRVILELGGNNGAIVSDKADMRIALKGVGFGALATAGQRCTTTRRLILHEKIYDEFLSRLIRAYEKAKVGNPLEEDTLVGPLIDEESVQIYTKAIEEAVRQGGRVLYGGKRLTIPGLENGHYVMPTIIEAKSDMPFV